MRSDFTSHSLASLLLRYCSYITDKRYQRSDWRIRPLPEEMLVYARSDTHFLISIYDHLRNALLEKSKDEADPQGAMREVLKSSAHVSMSVFKRDDHDEVTGKGYMGWLTAFKRQLLPSGAQDKEPGLILRRLWNWRDRIAREEDESPLYVTSSRGN